MELIKNKKQINMKKGTAVITHDNYVGVINGVTKQGYIVKFTNGKERHFLPNQLREYNPNKVNTYVEPKSVAELLKDLSAQVQESKESMQRLKEDAEQYKADYARGAAFAYGAAVDRLDMILNSK